MKTHDLVIGIKFGDNDFSNVFLGVLKIIAEECTYCNNVNKTKVMQYINTLAYPLYSVDCIKDDRTYDRSTKDYLMLTEDNILFGNDEVYDYIKTVTWNNGEDFFLDTRLPVDQQVFSI